MSTAPTARGRPDRRLVGVDATRGLALLGMMAVHVLPAVGTDGGATVAHAIAGGRSAATFAVLAGVGLALLTGGTDPHRGRPWAAASAGLVVRALCIGAVGLLLGSVDSGVAVILAYYAVLFVLAIPLLPLRAGPLFALGLTVACLVPVLSHLIRDDARLPFAGRNPTFDTLLDSPGDLVPALLLTGYYPVLAWTAYLCAGLAAGRLPLRERRTAAWLCVRRGRPGRRGVERRRGSCWVRSAAVTRSRRRCPTPPRWTTASSSASTGTHRPPPGGGWRSSHPTPAHPLDLLHTIGVALGLLGAMLLLASTGRSARAVARSRSPPREA